MTKFIAVISAKGGVGKTTSVINLASALQYLGVNTLIIDCDLSSPNTTMYLGLPYKTKTINDALLGKLHINETIHTHPCGIKVIPASISHDNIDEYNYEKFDLVLANLADFDVVILDTPPGLDKPLVSIVKLSNYVITVSTPDMIALTDTLKTLKLVKSLNKKILGTILNRYDVHDNIDTEPHDVEKFLDSRVVGVIPEDSAVKKSHYLRNPVVYAFPDSESAVGYKKIAAGLLGRKYEHSLAAKRPEEKSAIYYIFKNLGLAK